MSDQFAIKVRVMKEQFELQVSQEMTIGEIKSAIASRCPLPTPEQRVIFQGKVLSDTDTVEKCSLQPGFVLQVVKIDASAKAQESESLESEARSEPFATLQNLLNTLTPAMLFDRSARSRQRQRRSYPFSYKLESVRQNLMTAEILIATRNSPWRWTARSELFTSLNRRFQVGQWVDVKDTVDIWLEAQIIDIRDVCDCTVAHVHYNEWPSQWDEWIETTSDRIQPFRLYSRQSPESPVQSPFPVVVSEYVFAGAETLSDMPTYLLQATTLLSEIQPLLHHYTSLPSLDPPPPSEDSDSDFESPPPLSSSRIGRLKVGQQLGIVLDRLGRAVADLALMAREEFPPGELAPMPTLSESREVEPDAEIRIHAIFQPVPQRRS